MISKHTKLKSDLKRIIRGSEVEDIILFGSAVRGKEKPQDFDILVLFKNQVNKKLEYNIRKALEKYFSNLSIISKTSQTVLEETFAARESLLFEGQSLLSQTNFAKRYGFASLGLFKYGFEGWSKLKKTKFYYALNGRSGKKGIIDNLNLIKLSDGLLLSPLNNIEKLREFLDSWKINYLYVPLLLPERLNKKKLLESK